MQKRKLGNSKLSVSAIGLGLMPMSGVYGKGDDAESVAVIQHAIEQGVDFVDSSDMYGWGHNEELLGRAIKGRRDRVVVTTKFGQVKNAAGGPNLVDGSPRYVKEACERSLERLGIDEIDLYYQHRVDPRTPIEETVGAMSRLVEAGTVRCLGLSEASPQTIRRAHAVHPISALQSEYSLLYRNPAEETLPTCRELGITYVAYSPLGRGFLTGAIQTQADLAEGDRRREHPRFRPEHFDHNRKLVQRLEEIAREKGVTPSQLVLAWLLARGQDIVPIPGTRRKAHLDENLGALAVRLDPDDLARIDEAMPLGAAAGNRYPDGQMKTVHV
ncbi:MAG: aldo/keto reductase [Candidatus Rokuibacteriota bacterium]